MNHLNAKLRLIFYPFFLIAAILIAAYSFLNWSLFIKTYPFLVKEEVRNIFIPMALPWIPLIIWFRPRLKLLQFRKTARDPIAALIFLGGIAIFVPMALAQDYIATATGKLTLLESINDIPQVKDTRYYEIKNYVIDPVYTGSHFKRQVAGKHNENLNLTFYIVCPLYDRSQLPATDAGKVPHHLKVGEADTILAPPVGKLRSTSPNPLNIGQAPGPVNQPLFVVDGIPTDSASFLKISPHLIQYVQVLKGKAALALFGQRAKFGAVVVTTRPSQLPDSHDHFSGSLPDSVRVDTVPSSQETTLIRTIDQDSSTRPRAWVGVRYFKSLNNNLPQEEKEKEVTRFRNECWADYDQRKTSGYNYFDEIPYDDDYLGFQKAASYTKRYAQEIRFRLLEPKEAAFEKRNGSKLPWVFGSFLIASSILLFVLVLTPLKDQPGESPGLQENLSDIKNSVRSAFKILVPKDQFYATPLIIDLNLVVFLAMVLSGLGFINFGAKNMITWGGNYGPLISSGQWWRLLTSTFLHDGFIHLLVNMYALLFVGIFLEPVLGRTRFAICYVVTGIMASLASFKVHPAMVTVGASGAIFGMYGIFLAFLLRGLFPAGLKIAFLVSTSVFVAVNLVAGISGNTDNAAHVGGLVSGVLIGLFLPQDVNRETEDTA